VPRAGCLTPRELGAHRPELLIGELRVEAPQDEDGSIELRHRPGRIGSLVDQDEGLASHLVGPLGSLGWRHCPDTLIERPLTGVRRPKREVE